MPDLKLNLGSGDAHKPGFWNVDIAPPADELVDLRKPWPWKRSSVDEIYTGDCFEHIDNDEFRGQAGAIWCMNEAHRVLKPGGKLELIVPCLPGIAPFCDPTHKVFWCSDFRYYFDERWNNDRGERGRLGPSYGITALFRTVGGRSGVDWTPISYASDAPDRRKLFLLLETVK